MTPHPVDDVVHVDDRTFYVGRLAGNDVVLAMTGIGLANATETATAAFEHFRCPFRGAVYRHDRVLADVDRHTLARLATPA